MAVEAPIASVAFSVVEQPRVAVMPSVTLPLAPAVKRIELVPWPLVIVPLPIVQTYAAPLVNGTLAGLPVLFAQTDGGAVMVDVGGMQTTLTAAEKGEVPSPIDGPAAQLLVYDVGGATIGSPATTAAAAMVIALLMLLPA